jgi:hypothetical protein
MSRYIEAPKSLTASIVDIIYQILTNEYFLGMWTIQELTMALTDTTDTVTLHGHASLRNVLVSTCFLFATHTFDKIDQQNNVLLLACYGNYLLYIQPSNMRLLLSDREEGRLAISVVLLPSILSIS